MPTLENPFPQSRGSRTVGEEAAERNLLDNYKSYLTIHMILNFRSCDLMIYKYLIIILKLYDRSY
jgi:hypothetical protein